MKILKLNGLIFDIYIYICLKKKLYMPYSALSISGEILKRAHEKGTGISNMKLQKLLYIANGLHLAKKNVPLIEEPIEVWQYGPVIKNVYHQFSHYGNRDITALPISYQLGRKPEFDKDTEDIMEFVLGAAEKLTAIQLSNWTHAENSPWTKSQRKGDKVIPDAEMQEFFQQFLNPAQDVTGK